MLHWGTSEPAVRSSDAEVRGSSQEPGPIPGAGAGAASE